MGGQQTTIASLQARLGRMEHYLEQLLQNKYGPRSERLDPSQLQLFDQSDAEMVDDESAAPDDSLNDPIVVCEHQRDGRGRQSLPNLSDNKKCCPE